MRFSDANFAGRDVHDGGAATSDSAAKVALVTAVDIAVVEEALVFDDLLVLAPIRWHLEFDITGEM